MKYTNSQLIREYTRQAKNLDHNICFEIDKNKNPGWNGQTDYKMVEYMKGQLSIIREILNWLQNGDTWRDDQKVDYRLGSALREIKY